MRITVAICTYDRPAQLAAVLESLNALRVPTDVEWELLVINNDGTNGTDVVCQRWAGQLPILVLREPRAGLASARNRAIAAARGDYIAWLDDDTWVDPNWLEGYATAFARWPDAAVFGGAITPRFEGAPPDWVRRCSVRLQGPFALREPDAEPAQLQATGELPFGANYAVRLDVQRRYPYDPILGRRARALGFGNEESEVVVAILRAGHSGWWVPAARVEHCVPPARQTLEYLRAYFQAEGAYQALRGNPIGSARLLLVKACGAELRFRLARWMRQPEDWINDLIVASELWGMLSARSAGVGVTAHNATLLNPR
jgi:glucosyl-dolichyl phosphate glucuronosyltransferase